MTSITGTSLLALALGLSGAAMADADKETVPNKISHRLNPGHPTIEAASTGGTGTLSAISWRGGPVMTGAPNVHLIWYGNWAQSNGSDTAAGQQIVRDFMSGVSNSPYLAINSTYTGSNGTVSGLIGTVSEASVGYTNGTRLRDADISKIVSNYISSSGKKDSNAVYFVLTSSDVAETSGFCNKYCGWHTSANIQSTNIKYSFVGNANRCLASCAAQSTSPNGNAGVDGMLSVVAHELEETLTDPNPSSGWVDSSGAENADKCAWTFGHFQQTAANGASYNMTLNTVSGSKNYLIQRNLSNVDNKCYMNGARTIY
ncbi:hypothetical protein PFX98_14280 [Paucibacter sediminis]|uniref:Uncharacterized protein n=1 Tax=Paucibacter sediminis TaxID=3019553 RepID=A0AA95SLD0_9BURK|nr:hypothetical protein [Paucibacter sp. S2-9]WIT10102.1 hypothetical protein PFX98_14280 [Paucibacter sp. S2-9]